MGPQLIGPSGQTVPNQFGPHGQMVSKNLVPNQFGPPKQIFRLSRGIGCEDPNFLGPYVHEYQICCGSFVQGDQFYGYNLSKGTGSWGPEVRGSNGVWDQMCCNSFLDQIRVGIRIL